MTAPKAPESLKAQKRPEAVEIGQLIAAARTQKGWSQDKLNQRYRALCVVFGVDPTNYGNVKCKISRWENGHRIPDQRARRLLALALEVRPETLGLPLSPLADWPA